MFNCYCLGNRDEFFPYYSLSNIDEIFSNYRLSIRDEILPYDSLNNRYRWNVSELQSE